MKKITKILSLVLALLLIMSAFAGCKKESADATDPPKDPVKDPVDETVTDPVEEREHVELVLYNYVSIDFPGQKETNEAVNAYLKEKLNTTIEWHLLMSDEYISNMPTHVDSGGYFDICFTNASNLPFDTYVAKNAFLPLEDYVDEYLSGTKALQPQAAWDTLCVDGHQYAVPLPRDSATQFGIQINDTMVQDLGLEYPTFNTYFDLIDYLYEAKEARDAKYPEKKDQPIIKQLYAAPTAFWSIDEITSGNLVYANIDGLTGFEDVSETAFCPLLTEDFREWAKLRRQLVEDGIMAEDPTSYDPDGVLQASGEFLWETTLGTLSINEDAYMPAYKQKLILANESWGTTSRFKNGLAVSAKSKYPERALEVIELINTDPYLATLLRFGPEGVGWTDNDNDGVAEMTEINAVPYTWQYGWYYWNLGGLTVSKVPEGTDVNFASDLAKMNMEATPSDLMGFAFDPAPVETEIAACKNVNKEFMNTLTLGQAEDVDKVVDEYIKKLKDNGIEKIVAEANKQIQEWKAAK